MDSDQLKVIPINTKAKLVSVNHESAPCVIKTQKLYEFDENTYVKLIECDFHNGTIEVQVLSQLLPDAPDFARGFIGLAFRINDDDSAFESFYIRPTNGQSNDPVRKQHAVQYFSYPKYNFEYFRTHYITGFDGPANVALNQWINLRAEIKNETGKLYLNNHLVLNVDHLKHGASTRGTIGFFVDIGTKGFFKNFRLTPTD